MNDDFTPEDVAQMRRDGDFRAFMRTRRQPTLQTGSQTAQKPADERPGHVPGAWPIGVNAVLDPKSPPIEGAVCPCDDCATYAQGRPAGFPGEAE